MSEETLIYNARFSSVGPGKVTEQEEVHEATEMDLAMKLHYLKGVYIFKKEAGEGFTVKKMKESMFQWCGDYNAICGRFRRSDESGRPYIKLNDCGVRLVEAQCQNTVDEWLTIKDHDHLLSYHQPIGPELPFSPLVYVQLTRFKCGGLSIGLSWAHVLGDSFSLSNCVNQWPLFTSSPRKAATPLNPPGLLSTKDPFSAKQVEPVGDLWLSKTTTKMAKFSFSLTHAQLSNLQRRASSQNNQIPVFESLTAVIWKSIAKIRGDTGIITICKNNTKNGKTLANDQIISSVQADFSVAKCELTKLARLLVDEAMDERQRIVESVKVDNGVSDFIVYGANLTFVDLEGADVYGLKLNGYSPEFVSYDIEGAGDEGTVMVLPIPDKESSSTGKGRFVTVSLPESQVGRLKSDLTGYFESEISLC